MLSVERGQSLKTSGFLRKEKRIDFKNRKSYDATDFGASGSSDLSCQQFPGSIVVDGGRARG